MKVGIIFGGPSREREIAFAGGRTVYDNLNKSLFEPVPIFVDSFRNFILVDWQYLYKGSIRDFYPPVDALPPSPNAFQIYVESLGQLTLAEQSKLAAKIGRRIDISELSELIDVAFLALHGEFGEDGQIQGLLESLKVPYTGSGIRACAIGMDKAFQKKMMEKAGFDCPEVIILKRNSWKTGDKAALYQKAVEEIGFPMVVRPANQGSSIGVSIINESEGNTAFTKSINHAFFIKEIKCSAWKKQSKADKVHFIRALTDIREGVGLPLNIENKTIYHPEELLDYLEKIFAEADNDKTVLLESHWNEQTVIIEAFIHGREFSCIVAKNENGETVALPPTEIIKGQEVFDYRSKYLPGLSRKVTPIDLPEITIHTIRQECQRLFQFFEFNTYARIDGFITKKGTIFLNDPNTTSGMLPSSFFFHQAAEIGLNPSQFLTYIIRTSLQERIETTTEQTHYPDLLKKLDAAINSLREEKRQKKKIAVILGGYSFERHISVESGRNIFEKLASSDKYEPIPVFLSGNDEQYELYQIPINLLLKDNADDIRDKILNYKKHSVVENIRQSCEIITQKYASKDVIFEPEHLAFETLAQRVDAAFIALHGRPGEDGSIQKRLENYGIPYNGSDVASSKVTINKYETLQLLKQHGFEVADQLLVKKSVETLHCNVSTIENVDTNFFNNIKQRFGYPLIAKPVDDGCSSAVKVIHEEAELKAYIEAIFFRPEKIVRPELAAILGLQPKEEFPQKEELLIESLITKGEADHFLEITGGLLTHFDGTEIRYEIFEPSEALAGGEILSLEEKFLAGEGQNITPARLGNNKKEYEYIVRQIKQDFERAARLLNVQGYARIDAFVRIFDNKNVETIIIEINSLPGMTPATCIFHQAALNNYKPYHFIDKILEFGFTKMPVS